MRVFTGGSGNVGRAVVRVLRGTTKSEEMPETRDRLDQISLKAQFAAKIQRIISTGIKSIRPGFHPGAFMRQRTDDTPKTV